MLNLSGPEEKGLNQEVETIYVPWRKWLIGLSHNTDYLPAGPCRKYNVFFPRPNAQRTINCVTIAIINTVVSECILFSSFKDRCHSSAPRELSFSLGHLRLPFVLK